MKLKALLIAAAVSLTCVAARCQDEPVVTKISFTTLTRGFQKEVFFTADSLIVLENNRGEEKMQRRKLEPFEWEQLLKGTAGVEINKVGDLPSPTSKRAFDGARHSSITIHIKSDTSFTHTFDDENPHPRLLPLMEAIRNVSGHIQR